MRIIKLVDGTVYEVTRCGAMHNQLFLGLKTDQEWADVVLTFANPEKTQVIEHQFEGTETDHVFFRGFTSLIQVVVVDGGYNLMLEKR